MGTSRVQGSNQGFDPAVMLWSQEAGTFLICFCSLSDRHSVLGPLQVLEAVNSEGASFFPGASGEQILVSCVDWTLMTTGVRVQIGKEATSLELPLLLVLLYCGCKWSRLAKQTHWEDFEAQA